VALRSLVVVFLLVACGGRKQAASADAGPGAEIAVVVTLAGASPELMETEVIVPVEEALAALPGVRHVRAVAEPGRAEVRAGYGSVIDARAGLGRVRDAVLALAPRLPRDADAPVVLLVEPGRRGLVTLEDPAEAPVVLRRLGEMVRDRVQAAEGVASVRLCGGARRERVITIDEARLAAFGLSPSDVLRAVQAQDLALPSGRRAAEPFFAEVVVAERGGAPVRLADVALVADDAVRDACRATLGGRPVVVLEIGMRAGAESGPLGDALRAAQAALPAGVTLERLPPDAADVAITDTRVRWAPGAWPPELPASGSPEPEVVVTVDRDRAAALGVSVADAELAVQLATVGVVAGKVTDGAERVPVRMRVAAVTTAGSGRPALDGVRVRAAGGELVPLSAIARVEERPPARPILRENRRRRGA
jgi:multidrug efflux pump subunit AcrB